MASWWKTTFARGSKDKPISGVATPLSGSQNYSFGRRLKTICPHVVAGKIQE
jgi:hypothetical protein